MDFEHLKNKRILLVDDEQELLDMVASILKEEGFCNIWTCLLYTSPSPRDRQKSRMPSSA